MNEIEQRLWAEAEAEANDWMSNVGFGVVSNMLSYMNPAQRADVISAPDGDTLQPEGRGL